MRTTAEERILASVTESEVPDRHVLIQSDQPGAGLFIIKEGTVVVESKDGDIELGEGEFFGELALLHDAVHSARVRAAGPVRFLALARDDFTKLIDSEPRVARAMLQVLARRLWEATRA